MEECYFSHIKLRIFEVKIFAQKKKNKIVLRRKQKKTFPLLNDIKGVNNIVKWYFDRSVLKYFYKYKN